MDRTIIIKKALESLKHSFNKENPIELFSQINKILKRDYETTPELNKVLEEIKTIAVVLPKLSKK